MRPVYQHICAHICENLPAYMRVENTIILAHICTTHFSPALATACTHHMCATFLQMHAVDELLRFICLLGKVA